MHDNVTFDNFLDLVVRDESAAKRLIAEQPQLICATGLWGGTALHFFAIENYPNAVRFLANSGASVDQPNRFGDTPLSSAAGLGHVEVVDALLAHGANPNVNSELLGSILAQAVNGGHVQVVRLLLKAGADLNYKNDFGEDVLQSSTWSENNNPLLIAALKEFGFQSKSE